MSLRWMIILACGVGGGWAAWQHHPWQGGKEPSESPRKEARSRGLKGYHAKVAQIFALTPGFGLRRMLPVFKEVKDDVIFISPGEFDSESPFADEPALHKANETFRKIFAAAEPQTPFTGGYLSFPEKAQEPSNWRIERIDLVGLIDPEEPVVFVSTQVAGYVKSDAEAGPGDHPLPKNARLPDPFEAVGIEKLNEGKELFVLSRGDTVRMLGALRSTSQCAFCHDTKDGAVLGALSYTLRKQ